LGGLGLYVVGSIGCLVAPTIEALIGARFVQALGAAGAVVLARAIVRDIYPPSQAARLLSYISMAMALAPAIGPILGGWLTEFFGWRVNFLLLLLFGLTMLTLVALLLRETIPQRRGDCLSPAVWAGNYRRLLVDPVFLGYLLALSLAYSTIFAFISGSSFVFIDYLGVPPAWFGPCFATVPAGYMIGTFTSGRLTERLGIDRMILTGVTIMAVMGSAQGLAVLGGLVQPGGLGIALLLVTQLLAMTGVGLVFPNATAGGLAPYPEMAGTAAAAMGFAQMAIAALVGALVGAGLSIPGSGALPMSGAIMAVSLAALGVYWGLIRRKAGTRAMPAS
jgi:DHA1 family bicyclomycin/chloramphenicol resistance-like MFS transporter